MIRLVIIAAVGAAAVYFLRAKQKDHQQTASTSAAEGTRDAPATTNGNQPSTAEQQQSTQPQETPAPQEPASNADLAEQVRSTIDRTASHPAAIVVSVEDGSVTLSGQVPRDEEQPLVEGVRATPGVKNVTNQLEVQDHPGNVPNLTG